MYALIISEVGLSGRSGPHWRRLLTQLRFSLKQPTLRGYGYSRRTSGKA